MERAENFRAKECITKLSYTTGLGSTDWWQAVHASNLSHFNTTDLYHSWLWYNQVHSMAFKSLPHLHTEHSHLLQEMASSVQFSRSVVSHSLRPREPQHSRPPCPSPTPGVHPNPCPLCRWCHPTTSSSVIHFSSCHQSFTESGSFQTNQLFTWGGQSIGVSASKSVLPMNTQDWSPLGWTGWISLWSKGLSRVFSNTTAQKHQLFGAQFSL